MLSRVLFLSLCCLLPATSLAAELRVFVTVAPLGWLVQEIGGSRVEVRTLVKPGHDPHGFEPSPAQLGALQHADAYLSLGLPFERAWLPRMAALHPQLRLVNLLGDATQNAQSPLVSVPPRPHQHSADHAHDHGPDAVDPHIWTDPLRMLAVSQQVSVLLAELLPAAADAFQERQAEVAERLQRLHGDLAATFAAMPRKVFLVHHPAWGHLAARYGLTQLAIEHDGKEPGPRALAALAAEVQRQRIRTLFVEPQISDHMAHGLADTLGLQIQILDPLAADYEQNLRRVAARIVEGAS
jgi:zinc transport system substrate-binding protein